MGATLRCKSQRSRYNWNENVKVRGASFDWHSPSGLAASLCFFLLNNNRFVFQTERRCWRWCGRAAIRSCDDVTTTAAQ